MAGILSYNGITFENAATEITVSTEFVYDDKEQIIIAHRYTITAQTIATNDGSPSGDLDADIELIRQRLGESGGKLIFTDKGFGRDLKINVGAVKDIDGGPFPRILDWAPIGDDKACEIIWTVDVTVPICGLAVRYKGISAINWGVDYSINSHGDTTRTITGYLEIARPARSTDTADNYRTLFNPPPLLNFKREQQWNVSPDRRRITFTITDTEIPSTNPYPANITNIEGSHNLSFNIKTQSKLYNRINLNIRPEAGFSGAFAWKVFLTIAIQRLQAAKKAGKEVYIDRLELEDNLFGRSFNFSMGYRIMGTLEDDFAATAGLWRPIGTGWGTWQASLGDSVFNPRGTEGLKDLPGDSVTITLCDSQGAIKLPNNKQDRTRTSRLRSDRLKNEMPTADKSFSKFWSALYIHKTQSVARQKILGPSVPDSGGWAAIGGPPRSGVPTQGTFPTELSAAYKSDVLQQTGVPSYRAIFVGEAERVGHKIERPRVTAVGESGVVEIQYNFFPSIVGNALGVPVHRAAWWAEYELVKSPGNVNPPYDVKDGVDGIANKVE